MGALQVFAMWMPSGIEWIVVLVVALLLFGKRLPDVARSLGKGIVEFKKGVKGIEDEVESAQYEPPPKGQAYVGEPTKKPDEADSIEGAPKN